jgi:hypothetical protein
MKILTSGTSNSLVDDKYLKVMCDFCAEGLWTKKGAISPYSLPLSNDLRERIVAWNWWYDLEYDSEEQTMDMDAFTVEGLEIARQVKRELPDWTIIYSDEAGLNHAYKLEEETGQQKDSRKYIFEILLNIQ